MLLQFQDLYRDVFRLFFRKLVDPLPHGADVKPSSGCFHGYFHVVNIAFFISLTQVWGTIGCVNHLALASGCVVLCIFGRLAEG